MVLFVSVLPISKYFSLVWGLLVVFLWCILNCTVQTDEFVSAHHDSLSHAHFCFSCCQSLNIGVVFIWKPICSSTSQNCSLFSNIPWFISFGSKVGAGFTEQSEWEWEFIEQQNDYMEYCLCLKSVSKFNLQPGNVRLFSLHISWNV